MQGKVQHAGQGGCRIAINNKHAAVGAVSSLPSYEAGHTFAGEGAAGQAGLVATTVENSYIVNLGKQGIAQVGSAPCASALHVLMSMLHQSMKPTCNKTNMFLQSACSVYPQKAHCWQACCGQTWLVVHDSTVAFGSVCLIFRRRPALSVRQRPPGLPTVTAAHLLWSCTEGRS